MKLKATVLLALLLVIGWMIPAQGAVVPVFEQAEFITWGSGQTIMTDNNGVIPCVGDWDGDGVKDLLVGTYYYGNIYYYHNSGSNTNPVFPARVKLQADGSDISVSYG